MGLYSLIIAGGSGTRFWPRNAVPKQLLNLFGNSTMIQQSVSRVDSLGEENIYVVTNEKQKPLIESQVPDVHVIAEPYGRNTAAAIALGVLEIMRKDPDASIIVMPADHLISGDFMGTVHSALKLADKGIVCIGVKPTRAETGYGYIAHTDGKVDSFKEKPDAATAAGYVAKGYLWNAGIFIFKGSVFLEEMEKYLPKTLHALKTLDVDEAYSVIESISVDYAIMEKSSRVYVVDAGFSWNDVGSWEEAYNMSEKDSALNSVNGNSFVLDASGCYVFSDRPVALIGLSDVVVVNTADGLLVCSKSRSQDVKKAVEHFSKL